MKVIIAGSRHITDYAVVDRAIRASKWANEISVVLSGDCEGVDKLGVEWADRHRIPVEKYQADWYKHGRAAGPIRNALMAKNAERLIAIPHAILESRGTANMIKQMQELKKLVFVYMEPT